MGASSDLEASVFCGSWRSTSSSAVVFTACGLVLCSRCRVHVQARQNPRRSAALEHLGVHVRCPSLHSGGLFECMRLCALPMPCCSTSKFPALHRPKAARQQRDKEGRRPRVRAPCGSARQPGTWPLLLSPAPEQLLRDPALLALAGAHLGPALLFLQRSDHIVFLELGHDAVLGAHAGPQVGGLDLD